MEANAASGTSGSYGGSSGGGIVLACRTLAGSGQVLAKGSRGNSNGGAGAGGRIALHLDAAAQADLGAQLPLLDVTGTTGAKWFHTDAMQDFAMGSIYFSDASFLCDGWPVWKGWLHVPTNRGSYNGSGAGGGILLDARRIVGGAGGRIRADGADGNVYGGGGTGGRIACWIGIPEACGARLIRAEVTEQAVLPQPAGFEGGTAVLGGTGFTNHTGPLDYKKAGDGSVVWLALQGSVLLIRQGQCGSEKTSPSCPPPKRVHRPPITQ